MERNVNLYGLSYYMKVYFISNISRLNMLRPHYMKGYNGHTSISWLSHFDALRFWWIRHVNPKPSSIMNFWNWRAHLTFWNLCLSVTLYLDILCHKNVHNISTSFNIFLANTFWTSCTEIKQCWSKKLFLKRDLLKEKEAKRDLGEREYGSR